MVKVAQIWLLVFDQNLRSIELYPHMHSCACGSVGFGCDICIVLTINPQSPQEWVTLSFAESNHLRSSLVVVLTESLEPEKAFRDGFGALALFLSAPCESSKLRSAYLETVTPPQE